MGASANSSEKKWGHSKISVSILDHQKSVILMFTFFVSLLKFFHIFWLNKQLFVSLRPKTKCEVPNSKFLFPFFLKVELENQFSRVDSSLFYIATVKERIWFLVADEWNEPNLFYERPHLCIRSLGVCNINSKVQCHRNSI